MTEPNEPPSRTVRMQVIGAGLGRTGTTSLHAALDILGISPVHNWENLEFSSDKSIDLWTEQIKLKMDGKYSSADGIFQAAEQWDQILGAYAAIVDQPSSTFAYDLAKAYPKAKAILTVRDSPEAWLRSWRESIFEVQVAISESLGGRIMDSIDRFTGRKDNLRRILEQFKDDYYAADEPEIDWYLRAVANAHRYVPANRLLEFNVKQGWVPLCRFLGKEVPDVPFPRLNDSADYKEQFKRKIKVKEERLRSLVLSGGIIAVAAFALAWDNLTSIKF